MKRQKYSSARVQKSLDDMAYSTALAGPAQLATLLHSDIARWAPAVQKTGFKAEA